MDFMFDKKDEDKLEEIEKEIPVPDIIQAINKDVDDFMSEIPDKEEATVDTFVELSSGRGDDDVE